VDELTRTHRGFETAGGGDAEGGASTTAEKPISEPEAS
jgi:hypothetical protein